jgi:hypothetical protein
MNLRAMLETLLANSNLTDDEILAILRSLVCAGKKPSFQNKVNIRKLDSEIIVDYNGPGYFI